MTQGIRWIQGGSEYATLSFVQMPGVEALSGVQWEVLDNELSRRVNFQALSYYVIKTLKKEKKERMRGTVESPRSLESRKRVF